MQLNEKVANLETRQAVTDVSMCDLKEDIVSLKKQVDTGFKDITSLVLKGMCATIGILLTMVGFFVKMNL